MELMELAVVAIHLVQTYTLWAILVGLVWLAGRVGISWASCGLTDFDAGLVRSLLMALFAGLILTPLSVGVSYYLANMLGQVSPRFMGWTGVTLFVFFGLVLYWVLDLALSTPFVEMNLKKGLYVAVFDTVLNVLWVLLLGGILLAILAFVQVQVNPPKTTGASPLVQPPPTTRGT